MFLRLGFFKMTEVHFGLDLPLRLSGIFTVEFKELNGIRDNINSLQHNFILKHPFNCTCKCFLVLYLLFVLFSQLCTSQELR